MGSRKAGRTNFRVESFLHALLDDLKLSMPEKDYLQDLATISRRIRSEGISFATKTLPLLGKALEQALKTGHFICPSNFRRWKSTALPCFLKGLLLQIFDKSGNLVARRGAPAVAELRQVCMAFYKVRQPFTKQQQMKAEEKFLQVDESLPTSFPSDHPILSTILELANRFNQDLLKDFDPYDIVPGHGPGVVSSGEQPHEKIVFSTKYRRLHEQYPYYRYFYVNPDHLLHTCADYWRRDVKESGVSKVIFVPKDSRGPRTIAAEPLEYQFIQQGIMKSLYPYIESHPLTRGRVNFTDQTINQVLAYRGSLGEDLVTLDLKDASDSVSLALVERLFRGTRLLPCLLATRSTHSLLPSGKVVELKKFAPMGSALCFPIEALTFYSLLIACYHYFEGMEPLGYVYGDDIVIPSGIREFYSQILALCGLTVNSDKSCFLGRFRESCGADFWEGTDVTYLKVKTLESSSSDDILSHLALSNLLFERGYYRAADCTESWIPPYYRNRILAGSKTSEYLAYWNPRWTPSVPRMTFFKDQIPRFKAVVQRSITYLSLHHVDNTLWNYAEYFRKHLQGWGDKYEVWRYARRSVRLIVRNVSY